MITEKYATLMQERRQTLQAQLEPVLGKGGSFVCEIGCGHGHFLTAYAQAHPDKICLGLDLVSERIERACRKRDRAKLANLHFVQAEARLLLEMLPPAARVETFFILFPDPWPKARHHKHRILQPRFLAEAATKATPDCRLYFRTDYTPYFEDAAAVVRDDPFWRLIDAPWAFEFETVFQSRAPAWSSLVAARK